MGPDALQAGPSPPKTATRSRRTRQIRFGSMMSRRAIFLLLSLAYGLSGGNGRLLELYFDRP